MAAVILAMQTIRIIGQVLPSLEDPLTDEKSLV